MDEAAVPVPVLEFTRGLVNPLRNVLDESLRGFYLYGSSTLGDFDPQISDIDLMLVVEEKLSDEIKSALIRMIWSTAALVPARGLECWVFTTAMTAAKGEIQDYELFVYTHPQEPMTRDGATDPGGAPVVDLDLVRETGLALFGQPPSESIGLVPKEVILQSMIQHLEYSLTDSSESYLVLNSSRSLAFAVTGRHLSKIDGARWAAASGLNPALVEAAIRSHLGLAPDGPATSKGRRYAEDVIRRIKAEV